MHCEQCGATHGTFVKSEATGWRWICVKHLPKLGKMVDRRKNRGENRRSVVNEIPNRSDIE